MPQVDTSQRIAFAQLLEPSKVTSTQTATAVDLQNAQGATVHLRVGTYTDGTFTPKLQDSADNSTFADVAAANLQGAFTVINSTTQSSTDQVLGYLGNQRYLRSVVTAGSTTTGALLGIEVVTQLGRKLPAENS